MSVLLITGERDIQRKRIGQAAAGKDSSQNRATVSARHSSIEEDTSPSTEPGVCPGLYQDELRAVFRLRGQHDSVELTPVFP
jgi:hypothetical protein